MGRERLPEPMWGRRRPCVVVALVVLMIRPVCHRALTLIVLLQLCVSGQPALGLTLCLADDGHASLELSHAESPCVREARRHHPGEPVLAADELTHHPCRDIPILENHSCRVTRSPADGLPTLSALPLALFRAFDVVRAVLPTSLDAHRPDELSQRFLRSVILLV
jgi:hypothetical protein